MKFKFISLLTLLLAIVFPLHAEIKPATIFGSNMVLQRGEPVKVWGTATRNERYFYFLTVKASARRRTKTAGGA